MIFGIEPFDIAKEPQNWYLLSREFYISARTLEDIKKNENINKNDFIGKVVNKEVLLKMEKSKLRTPIIFNYSFAIELILKAILIKSKPNLFITKNREVKFHHKMDNFLIAERPNPVTNLFIKTNSSVYRDPAIPTFLP